MRRETDTQITGKLAIWLGLLFSVVAVVLVIVNAISPDSLPLSIDIALAFIVSIFTLLAAYLYGRIENLSAVQEQILAQPVQGVELFESADGLLARLAEVTVGARRVATLNLSPQRGATRPLDEYFHAVHKYLQSRHAAELSSFRTLAHVNNEAKAKWIISRTRELIGTGRFSQAIFDAEVQNVFPVGFHAVEKNGATYVFFFPGVSLTGAMRCFAVKDRAIYDVMMSYFEMMWSRSSTINEGRSVRRAGLDKLELIAPSLGNDAEFIELARGAQ